MIIDLELQGDSGDGRREVIELSDSDGVFDNRVQGLDRHVHCARCHLPFRRLVLSLPAIGVPASIADLTTSSLPSREGDRSRDEIDRAKRASYMREWQAKAKRQRIEARDVARRTPRRSPRLASNLV